MGKRICTKCGIEKSLSDFNYDKKGKYGKQAICRFCMRIYHQKYYEKNNEKVKCKVKDDYKKRKEHILIYQREYSKNNKEKIKERNKLFFQKNKVNIYKKIQYRMENDYFYKLKSDIRKLICVSFKNKGVLKNTKSEIILGCKFEDFKLYLESKFETWMTWDNKGNPKDGIFELNKTWDIDHIIPLSIAKTEEDIIRLNHYTNLQPLCSYVNRFIKINKLIWKTN